MGFGVSHSKNTKIQPKYSNDKICKSRANLFGWVKQRKLMNDLANKLVIRLRLMSRY